MTLIKPLGEKTANTKVYIIKFFVRECVFYPLEVKSNEAINRLIERSSLNFWVSEHFLVY